MKVFKLRIEGDENPNWHLDIIGRAANISDAITKGLAYAEKKATASYPKGPFVTSVEEVGDLVF